MTIPFGRAGSSLSTSIVAADRAFVDKLSEKSGPGPPEKSEGPVPDLAVWINEPAGIGTRGGGSIVTVGIDEPSGVTLVEGRYRPPFIRKEMDDGAPEPGQEGGRLSLPPSLGRLAGCRHGGKKEGRGQEDPRRATKGAASHEHLPFPEGQRRAEGAVRARLV